MVDMAEESDLIFRAETYAKDNRRRIVRKAWLGGGTDGEVWRSTRPSAIKVVLNARNYPDWDKEPELDYSQYEDESREEQ